MLEKIRNLRIKENVLGYVFILPGLIFTLMFVAYPVISSIFLSFTKWKGRGDINFTGLSNYINMFTKDLFFKTALKNSILFSLGAALGTVLLGFIFAVIIDLKVPLHKFFKFVFFLPVVISIVSTSLLWLRILDPYGLLNTLLTKLHMEGLEQIWLGNPKIALLLIIIVTIWQYNGFPMIFFLAGMQNIDEGIYEAAKIDGASTIRRVFTITIPLLKNVFAIILTLQLIFTLKVFDVVWIMTNEGPAGSTAVLGTQLYVNAFHANKFGYASVISVILFILAIIFSIIYIKVSGYRE
jgi:ABC-type sugar transport system permease subunit